MIELWEEAEYGHGAKKFGAYMCSTKKDHAEADKIADYSRHSSDKTGSITLVAHVLAMRDEAAPKLAPNEYRVTPNNMLLPPDTVTKTLESAQQCPRYTEDKKPAFFA